MKSKIILGVLPSYSSGGAEKVMLMYLNALEKTDNFFSKKPTKYDPDLTKVSKKIYDKLIKQEKNFNLNVYNLRFRN